MGGDGGEEWSHGGGVVEVEHAGALVMRRANGERG